MSCGAGEARPGTCKRNAPLLDGGWGPGKPLSDTSHATLSSRGPKSNCPALPPPGSTQDRTCSPSSIAAARQRPAAHPLPAARLSCPLRPAAPPAGLGTACTASEAHQGLGREPRRVAPGDHFWERGERLAAAWPATPTGMAERRPPQGSWHRQDCGGCRRPPCGRRADRALLPLPCCRHRSRGAPAQPSSPAASRRGAGLWQRLSGTPTCTRGARSTSGTRASGGCWLLPGQWFAWGPACWVHGNACVLSGSAAL